MNNNDVLPMAQDIVQGSFLDTYKNLTYKSVMGQHWVSTNCQVLRVFIKVIKAKDHKYWLNISASRDCSEK